MQILTKANIYYVAVGSVCGGILMFLTVLIICCFKYNLRVTILKVNKTSMKMIIGAILPVCIISSFTSINLMLDKFFASLLGDGAVAILSYSYKIVNLPVYLFITSVTKVMLPDVTRLILNEHKEELSKIIKRIVLFCISGAVVTVILFQLLGNWVVQLLFGRGAFGGKDIAATAISLKFYACGIAGMALSSFFQSISYAGGRFFEPFGVLFVQMIVYIGVTCLTIKSLGVNGIILGNIIAFNISIIIWLIILKKNYKTKNSETLDYIALKDIVFKEIEEYISTLNINDEFELYDASETFRNIPMTKEGKPNVNRAKLGRLFGQSIGKKPFENVERVYIANGNVKKSRYNKATMFKRTK